MKHAHPDSQNQPGELVLGVVCGIRHEGPRFSNFWNQATIRILNPTCCDPWLIAAAIRGDGCHGPGEVWWNRAPFPIPDLLRPEGWSPREGEREAGPTESREQVLGSPLSSVLAFFLPALFYKVKYNTHVETRRYKRAA